MCQNLIGRAPRQGARWWYLSWKSQIKGKTLELSHLSIIIYPTIRPKPIYSDFLWSISNEGFFSYSLARKNNRNRCRNLEHGTRKNLPSAFFIVQRPHPSQDDHPRPEIPASNTRVVPFYLFSFIRFLAFNFQKFNFKRTVFDIQWFIFKIRQNTEFLDFPIIMVRWKWYRNRFVGTSQHLLKPWFRFSYETKDELIFSDISIHFIEYRAHKFCRCFVITNFRNVPFYH